MTSNKKKCEIIFEFLIGLSISVLPWNLNLNSYLIVILFAIAFFDLVFNKKQIKSFPFNKTKLIIIPYLIFFLRFIFSNNYENTIGELTSTVSFIVIPFIFFYYNKYYKLNYNIIFSLFIFSCIAKFFVFFINLIDFDFEALLSFSYWKTLLVRLNGLLNSRSIHPTYYSLFIGISVYLASYLFFNSKNNVRKIFWGFIISILMILIISITAKMPIIAFIVSLVSISILDTIIQFNKRKIIIYTTSLVIVLSSLIYYIHKIPNTFIQEYDNYKNLLFKKKISDVYDYSKYGSNSELDSWKKTNRVFIWKAGIQVWKNHWLFGTGIDDYKKELNKQYLKNGYLYMAKANMNTHNQYLSYITKYGVFGFIIIICMILQLIKAYRSGSYLFTGIFIYFMGVSFTENILERQLGIVCFSFFVSLFIFKSSLHKPI